MFDPHSVIATLVVATFVLASVSLVLSRIIPDEYDRGAPVRQRVHARVSRRGR
jgi:hypothetical protein